MEKGPFDPAIIKRREKIIMKKIFKVALGAVTAVGTACGALYFAEKVLGIDILKKKKDDDLEEDFDDEEFDDDSEEEEGEPDSGDREYVTLDMDGKESEEANDGGVDAAPQPEPAAE